MTQVAFHIGIDDRVGYACRLLRKAVASGAKALVVGEPDTLAALDKALWDFEQTSFFAHARADAPGQALQHICQPNRLAVSSSIA